MLDSNVGQAVKSGLVAGVVAVSVRAIGMVEAFDERDIIIGVLSLGQLLFSAAPLIVGYMVSNPSKAGMTKGLALVSGWWQA